MEPQLSEHVKLTLNAKLGEGPQADYDVTLIRAGNALNGWRFPAPILQAAVPRFEGASCFVDHVGWFGSGASVRDLVGVMTDVAWAPDAPPKGRSPAGSVSPTRQPLTG